MQIFNFVTKVSNLNGNSNSNPSSQGSLSSCTSDTNSTLSKLSQIKAELSSRGSTPSMNRIQNLHSITECHPTTEPNKRRVFVKQQTQVELKAQKSIDSTTDVEPETCRSLTNLTNSKDEMFTLDFVKKKDRLVGIFKVYLFCGHRIFLNLLISKTSSPFLDSNFQNM